MAVLETVLPGKLKANLQKAYKAYLVLQVHEDDERAEDTLYRCDDFFFDHEDQIEAILRGYASGIQLRSGLILHKKRPDCCNSRGVFDSVE